jgi:hypothetical protein
MLSALSHLDDRQPDDVPAPTAASRSQSAEYVAV